jgi:hypothetical protein
MSELNEDEKRRKQERTSEEVEEVEEVKEEEKKEEEEEKKEEEKTEKGEALGLFCSEGNCSNEGKVSSGREEKRRGNEPSSGVRKA